MLYNSSDIKVIHWEYNEGLISQDCKGTPTFKSGLMYDRSTNKPSGVYFRWTYLLHKDGKTAIHLVAEDVYKIVGIPVITLPDLKTALSKSFTNFQDALFDRLDQTDQDYPILTFPITDGLLKPILAELNRELQ